jgi:RNA-directed DNA polymerase
MNVKHKSTCAPSERSVDWHSIDWVKCHANVRRLQRRIVKATQQGRWGKVKALQRLLTTSFSGKALAVKRVTENQGKRTPGVDKETWSTPKDKSKGLLSLKRHGYRPSPLRRVYIPKANGKKRPLGIPTIKDRAMQALYLLALEPIAETLADPNSYGFRPGRSTADATQQCFQTLAKADRAQWILEGDIKGCFDNISHEWLLANIPTDKTILKKWLKSGFLENQIWYDSYSGTPQGGIISPVLANLTLDGLETLLKRHFPKEIWHHGKRHYPKVNLIRYADDFVITGESRELLEYQVKPILESFLAERGLSLSPEKTVITPVSDGFDFLGQNVRKYHGKLLIKPSKKSVKSLLHRVRSLLKKHQMAKQEVVINVLNPIIRGWALYHRHVVAKEVFSKVDHWIWQAIWNWACFRHPNKGRRWIMKKYFHSSGNRNWVFSVSLTQQDTAKLTDKKQTSLVKSADYAIQRHIKIRSEANPYDPAWEMYFEERLRKKIQNRHGGKTILRLWLNQEGKCPQCQQSLKDDDVWNIHHIRPKHTGGSDTVSNLMILHANCHRQVHASDIHVVLPASHKLRLKSA